MRNIIFTTLILGLAATLSAKSLWTSKKNNEAGMFADRLATRVGDILMVEIDEETVVNRSSSKNTSSNTSINHGITELVVPGVTNGNETFPKVNLSPTDSFSGSGSVAESNVMQARIAVLVVDVLPNGNLVVEGARKIESSKETQYVVMRGMVRRDDVSPANTVMSYNILNSSVEVLGDGDLMTAQRKSWLNQLIDAVNIL